MHIIGTMSKLYKLGLRKLLIFLDLFLMGVWTTRHWKTSGRLVQELNVCTIPKCLCYGFADDSK